MTKRPAQRIVRRRPAESTTALTAAVIAAVQVLGLDLSTEQLTGLVVLVGLVPTAVTWLVELYRGQGA